MKQLGRYAKFLYVQRVSGFSVAPAPLLGSPDATAWFSERLRQCRAYLEFGAGGSTCFAAAADKPLVTIDSDPYFLTAVRTAIERNRTYRPAQQTFIYRDIGPITWWGTPVFRSLPGRTRARKFRHYSDVPLGEFRGALPDLVLVDGRFRVACALKAMRALTPASGWTLVVDDYADRPHYHVLERFAQLRGRIGRLAVFDGLRAEGGDLDACITAAEMDCR